VKKWHNIEIPDDWETPPEQTPEWLAMRDEIANLRKSIEEDDYCGRPRDQRTEDRLHQLLLETGLVAEMSDLES